MIINSIVTGNLILKAAERVLGASAFHQLIPTLSITTSTSTEAKSTKPKAHKEESSSKPSSSPALPKTVPSLDQYRRCRFDVAYHEILYRELMLKIGAMEWTSVPRIKSITLSINAAQDTRLEKTQVTKPEMLLHLLALEKISGMPASFMVPANQPLSGKAEGVTVTLTGEAMFDFLEKIVYMILPNQIGFEGASMPQVVPGKAPRPGKQPPKMYKEPANYFSELKVTNLMLYPDFEQNFEIFEPLRSMQVRFEIEGAPSSEVAAMLLSAFALPIQKQADPMQ